MEENHVKIAEEGLEAGKGCLDRPDTAAVIGIKGASVVFTGIAKLKDEETDWDDRRPRRGFWRDLKDIVDTLGGRKGIPVEPK